MTVKRTSGLLLLPTASLLGGCHMVLLDPSGHVARQQSDIMLSTTALIALIIVPVMIAIAIVAWRYRASNKKADYQADWDHSARLELLVWAAPLMIIIAVGSISWIGTHQLDPYRPLDHVNKDQPVTADTQALEVEVVSLPWKWLFFYPQYGVATVNELAAPVDVPIHFDLTSSAMMDSFFVPDLAGMIYTMPGMQTQLHAVINKPGVYKGMSANYSGHGFTDMRFKFHGLSQEDFDAWVARVRAAGGNLDRAAYHKLDEPSRGEPVRYYASYQGDLYTRILNRCVDPGQMCMNKQMADDAARRGQAMGMNMDMPAKAPATSDEPTPTVTAHGAATH